MNERMKRIGLQVASKLRLNGLTDVQALVKKCTPVVNELNARLPSQTPTVVFHSTKTNIVELLVRLFLERKKFPTTSNLHQGAVLYQHVKVLDKELRVQGEHILADARGLRREKDFLGADEMITNLELGAQATNRVATLIVKSRNLESASRKMRRVIRNIMNEYHLRRYIDPSPGWGRRS